MRRRAQPIVFRGLDIRQGPGRRRSAVAAAVAAAIAGLGHGGRASATVYTYTGPGGTAAAPTSGNFSVGFTPTGLTSATSNELDFNGSSTAYTATDDIAGALLLNRLVLNSTTANTIAASSTSNVLEFAVDSGNNPILNQSGAGAFNIGLGITLDANVTLGGTGAGILTLSGPIGGSGGFVKSSTDQLVLSGANTFGGGLTENAGAVNISNGSALGTGTLTLNSSGGLIITGTAVTLANNIVLGPVSGNITFLTPTSSSTILNGTLSGGGASTVLYFQGGAGTGGINTGALTLNGTNTGLAGTINVQRGPLILGNASAAGSTLIKLDSNIPAAGALQLAGSFTIANNVLLQSGTETLGVGTGLVGGISGTIYNVSGSSLAISKVGAGTLVLSGSNAFGGGVAISAGSLAITTPAALGTGNLSIGSGASTSSTPPAFNVSVNAAVTVPNNIVVTSTASTYLIDKLNTTSTGGGTQLDLTGNISGGSAGTTLELNSTLGSDYTTSYRLDGSNSFLGTIDINRGALVIGNANAAGNAATIIKLDSNGNSTLGNLRFAASMTLPNPVNITSAYPINTDVNNVTLNGVISGAGPVTKLGTGTLTLGGINTYTGGTTVTAGTLSLAAGASLVNGAISVPSGTTFQVAPGTSAGSTTIGTTSLTLASGSTFNLSSATTIGNFTLTQNSSSPAVSLALNGTTLNFGIGNAGVDGLIATGLASNTAPNTVNLLPLAGATALKSGTFNLISASAGLSNGSSGGFAFGGTGGATTESLLVNGVNYTLNLVNTDAAEQLLVSAGNTSFYYTGKLSNVLTATSGGSSNFNTDATSGADAGTAPGANSDVFFTVSPSSVGGPAKNLSTVLGADLTINTLNFTADATSSVTIGGANTLTIGGGINVASGSGAHTISTAALALAATQTWLNNSANPFTVSAPITGSANTLTLAGTSTAGNAFVLSGNNSYGATTINSGVGVQVGAGGTSGTLGTGAVVDNGTLTFNRSDAATVVAGAISGTGSITQSGAGVAIVGGAITTTGTTTVNSGALQAPSITGGSITVNAATLSAPTVAAGGALTINNGGTLMATNVTASATGGAVTVNAGGTLTSSNLSGGAANGAVTVAGNLTATTSLTVGAATGAFTINSGGTVTAGAVTVPAALNALTIGSNATLTSTGTLTVTASAARTSGYNNQSVIGGSGVILLQGNLVASLPQTTGDYGVAIGAYGSTGPQLNLSSGTHTISGASGNNSYGQYDDGDLTLYGSLAGTGNLVISGTPASSQFEVVTFADNSNWTGGLTLTRGDFTLANGYGNGLTASNTVTFNPASGNVAALYLFGNTTTVGSLSGTAAGSMYIRNGASDGGSSSIYGVDPNTGFGKAAALTVNQTTAGTFAGVISDGPDDYYSGVSDGTDFGPLSITKTGAATLVLSGANTYSGGTTLSGGTLRATNATSSLGTGPVTISSGGTLAGTGRTGAGTVTINAGGTITAGTGATPADAIGRLTTGSQTWAGGTYVVKLDGTVATPAANGSGGSGATAADVLMMSGLSTSGSSPVLTISPAQVTTGAGTGGFAGGSTYSFLIAEIPAASAPSGQFEAQVNGLTLAVGTPTGLPNGTFGLSASTDGAGDDLLFLDYAVATPEPASLLLLGATVAPLSLGRRRRPCRA